MTIADIQYYSGRAWGDGKSFALAAAIDVASGSEGFWFIPGRPVADDAKAATVYFEPLYENRVSHALLWGLLKGAARSQAEPHLHSHNILHNVSPRQSNPALPLAGTVFDPRRYRRP